MCGNTIRLCRQIQRTAWMDAYFTGEAQAIAQLVIACNTVNENGHAFDYEIIEIGEPSSKVPWMRLVKDIAFDVKSHIQRFENRAHAAI